MASTFEQTRSDLLRRSQSMMSQAVDRGTGMLADRVEHYTNVAREIGDILRERGEPQAADMMQVLAERGTSAARYLRNNDGTKMWNDAQELARGRTWVLTGAGFIGGLAIARAIRTAADGGWERTEAYRDSYAQPYTQRTGRYEE
jgi:hypothetical protein